ncbi:MAG TPA: hypothetical protein V6D31_06800 [Candidatus Sericytochromatia bacterium]|jgi:hypothetical protein
MEIEEGINVDRSEIIKLALAEVFCFVEDLEQQVKEKASSFQQAIELAENVVEGDICDQNESLLDFGF